MNTAPDAINDYLSPNIQALIKARGWDKLSDPYARIGAAYQFVKDEIRFGYNSSDDLPASTVLEQGYGQCNTKANLLFALLSALQIPTRFHGFTIDKALQRGAIPELIYPIAPQEILHSWIEVYFNDQWIELEGFILDADYLGALQQRFSEQRDEFLGYGAATPCLSDPQVEWTGESTYIQRDGIARDLGTFATPTDFYKAHGTNLSGPKRLLYTYLIRHLMNANVSRIRQGAARPVKQRSGS